MYKQCRTEQSSNRQRELERGLLQVMLKKHYDEISVTDLCQEMGIPRKAFYRYFSDKDGALQSLVDHTIMDFGAYTTANNIWELQDEKRYMEKILEFWVAHKDLLDALTKSNLSGILVQHAIRYTQELRSVPPVISSADLRLRNYGTLFIVCGLMSVIIQWHQDGFQPALEQVAATTLRLLSKPLLAPGT
jgi:AcrR family transcriptional regulator